MYYSNQKERDTYLTSVARDAIQALLTKVWQLPNSVEDGMIYAKLPKAVLR